MWPDRVSNPGPLFDESDALPTALRGPAHFECLWGHRILIFVGSSSPEGSKPMIQQ